jgi:hypothetical protein
VPWQIKRKGGKENGGEQEYPKKKKNVQKKRGTVKCGALYFRTFQLLIVVSFLSAVLDDHHLDKRRLTRHTHQYGRFHQKMREKKKISSSTNNSTMLGTTIRSHSFYLSFFFLFAPSPPRDAEFFCLFKQLRFVHKWLMKKKTVAHKDANTQAEHKQRIRYSAVLAPCLLSFLLPHCLFAPFLLSSSCFP